MSLRARRRPSTFPRSGQWASHLQIKSLANELYRRTGIVTTKEKMHRVEEAFLRLHEVHGKAEIEETRIVILENPQVWQEFVNSMTVNESYLFRDKKLLEIFAKKVLLPLAMSEKPIRIWSAASSTGDEATTLCLLCRELEQRLPFDWSVDGSDIDTEAVLAARQGFFEMRQLKDVPKQLLFRYFTKCLDGRCLLEEGLRQKLNFFQHNLIEPRASGTKYDLIFLRNVLIYFDLEKRVQVFRNLAQQLRPGGFLFLGHAESVPEVLVEWQKHREEEVSFYSLVGASNE